MEKMSFESGFCGARIEQKSFVLFAKDAAQKLDLISLALFDPSLVEMPMGFIATENLPVEYGGLMRENDGDFNSCGELKASDEVQLHGLMDNGVSSH